MGLSCILFFSFLIRSLLILDLSFSLSLNSFVETNTPWQQKVLRIINTSLFLLLLLLLFFSVRACMCVRQFFFLLLSSTLFELRYCLFDGERQFLSCLWMNEKTEREKKKVQMRTNICMYVHISFFFSNIYSWEKKKRSNLDRTGTDILSIGLFTYE